MNNTSIRRALLALVVLACIALTTTPAWADAYDMRDPADTPSAAAMAADLFLVRPLGFVSTVAGTGIFVLSLPFSLLGDNVGDAGHKLVVEPGAYTFTRPLGDF